MGTRSTYLITQKYGEDTQPLALIYHQFDGYPSGHPVETAKWLAGGKVVNGLGTGQPPMVFNGAGCMAAQLIAKTKEGPGGVYLKGIAARGNCWEDYLYEIIVDDEAFTIEFVCCENNDEKTELYRGTPQGFVDKVEAGELN